MFRPDPEHSGRGNDEPSRPPTLSEMLRIVMEVYKDQAKLNLHPIVQSIVDTHLIECANRLATVGILFKGMIKEGLIENAHPDEFPNQDYPSAC
jgi:hypothetical protein